MLLLLYENTWPGRSVNTAELTEHLALNLQSDEVLSEIPKLLNGLPDIS